jgi:uncharacterized protein YbjT (DUF2867 family)
MSFIRKLAKGVGYLAAAAVVTLAGYVVLMSGMFHTPRTLADIAQYRPVGGPILVVGGTSGTGLDIVRQLRELDAEVVVTVRPTSNTAALEALGARMITMDALDREQVFSAINADNYAAVISTLGTSARDVPRRRNALQNLVYGQPRMDPAKRPDFVGNRNVIDAAVSAGIQRFLLITVIGAGDSADAVPLPARRRLADVIPLKTQAEDYLRDSGLAYTIIRPGGLGPRNLQQTGTARLTEDPRSFSYIARSDLASLTIATLNDPQTIARTYTAYDTSRRNVWNLFID